MKILIKLKKWFQSFELDCIRKEFQLHGPQWRSVLESNKSWEKGVRRLCVSCFLKVLDMKVDKSRFDRHEITIADISRFRWISQIRSPFEVLSEQVSIAIWEKLYRVSSWIKFSLAL